MEWNFSSLGLSEQFSQFDTKRLICDIFWLMPCQREGKKSHYFVKGMIIAILFWFLLDIWELKWNVKSTGKIKD